MVNLERFSGLLAPDGSSVSQNFSRWFGNSVAKDDQGPRVLFRGDRTPVDVYESRNRRETGIFLAAEEARAAVYGNAHPFFIRMENPLDLREVYSAWRHEGPVQTLVNNIYESYYAGDSSPETGEPYNVSDVITGIEEGFLWSMDGTGGFTMGAWREIQNSVLALGYDGLIIHDTGEGLGKGVSYVVFNEFQLKSARDNVGFFNIENPSVRDDPRVLQAIAARAVAHVKDSHSTGLSCP